MKVAYLQTKIIQVYIHCEQLAESAGVGVCNYMWTKSNTLGSRDSTVRQRYVFIQHFQPYTMKKIPCFETAYVKQNFRENNIEYFKFSLRLNLHVNLTGDKAVYYGVFCLALDCC